MTPLSTVFTVAALVAGIVGTAQAQNRGMPSMLREGSPQVGDALPGISIYTDDGTPIQTRQLDGKFKVIVFGCLT
ncbi:MAG: hypothetical protein IIB55_02130 [Planctomycetes bacterium]|nr:hypothetical protein [Planctomycetota bacterium]MCH9057407.1 hypothetical protein [Planctomycetota bacterium]